MFGRRTSSGLAAFLTPVPSFVYMSSAFPAFGKHRMLRRGWAVAVPLLARPGNHLLNSVIEGATKAGDC